MAPKPDSPGLIDEIESRWSALALQGSSKLRQSPLARKIAGRPVGVGVDPLGVKHGLVPVPDGSDQKAIWRSPAVVVHRSNLKGRDGSTRTWLDFHCLRPDLESAFVRLLADVIERLPADISKVEKACISALQEWRELLGSGRVPERQSEVIGMVGELLALHRLAKIDSKAALDCWQGPRGGRHDFRRASKALEVKATTVRKGRIVEVHGSTQLSDPPDGSLHLMFTRLERVDKGSISIRALAKSIRDLGVDTIVFSDLLEDKGFGDLDAADAKMTFEHLESMIYPVGPDFPRIIATSFASGKEPAGVVSLDYRIDLLGFPGQPLDGKAEDAFLRSLLSQKSDTDE